ncbi:CKLF-like MARVEL transmembrane domain-containing protein 2 [Perognathus longimembris pacificus]|uniref:CKLF-like MARVEL transmembrane domain-containing protein 2 n=1 Tax=Perognathus longimembris pacificus TaxID=214514 RepID=UPI00201A10D4|nr:CKLF-like MARVEL transmembrane domain-containing protein 2 [Perognathus longimembris pacificus]
MAPKQSARPGKVKGSNKPAPAEVKGKTKAPSGKAPSAEVKGSTKATSGEVKGIDNAFFGEVIESNKAFWTNGHGLVKVLGLICLIISIQLFAMTSTHPILTLILYMELVIAVFFIILYLCAINRFLSFIIWPISDFLNDLFCCLFLVGGLYFAYASHTAMPINYLIAMVFMVLVAIFAFIDMYLQKKSFPHQEEKADKADKADKVDKVDKGTKQAKETKPPAKPPKKGKTKGKA